MDKEKKHSNSSSEQKLNDKETKIELSASNTKIEQNQSNSSNKNKPRFIRADIEFNFDLEDVRDAHFS